MCRELGSHFELSLQKFIPGSKQERHPKIIPQQGEGTRTAVLPGDSTMRENAQG
jgi:hypothetical protein